MSTLIGTVAAAASIALSTVTAQPTYGPAGLYAGDHIYQETVTNSRTLNVQTIDVDLATTNSDGSLNLMDMAPIYRYEFSLHPQAQVVRIWTGMTEATLTKELFDTVPTSEGDDQASKDYAMWSINEQKG